MIRHDQGVKLASNGAYWQANYRDSGGVRRTVSLGAKANLSRREALKACSDLAGKLAVEPGARDVKGKPPTLGDWGDRYPALIAPEVAEATVDAAKLALKHLATAFGKEVRIDRITKAMADDWKGWLMAEGEALIGGRMVEGRNLAEASAAGHIRYAKAAFKRAVGRGLLSVSPFVNVSGEAPKVDRDWADITEAQVERMLLACPTPEWRALLGLCAYAGTRRGEALALRKDAVQFEKHRIIIPNIKTRRRNGEPTRECYLEPRLAAILREVIPVVDGPFVAAVGDDNLYRTMMGYTDRKQKKHYEGILEKAGIARYKKPFHTLRKNRSTSWKSIYPEHVVDRWLGHGPEVARKSYNKVPEAMYGQHQDELARLRAEVAKLKGRKAG